MSPVLPVDTTLRTGLHASLSKQEVKDLVQEYHNLSPSNSPDIGRLLRFAIANKNLPVVKHLLDEHGGDLCQLDVLGRSAIFYLAVCDNFDVAKFVIDQTCQSKGVTALEVVDDDSRTTLWYAVKWAADETVTLLLSRGADPYTCRRISDMDEDRRRLIRMLRLSRLVGFEPDMRLTVSRRVRKQKSTYYHTCTINELQKNLDCWSEPLRQGVQLGTRVHHLTWISCPNTNVSPSA